MAPAPTKLSIIIPAFNEEKYLPACLASVRAALERVGVGAEVIVCDNNSTDATARIAREGGAAVVFEPENQISRARNAGAKASTGDWLLFIDADSILDPATLEDTLGAIRTGKLVGGGCLVRFDRIPGLWGVLTFLWNVFSRLSGEAAGSYVFCRADAFRDVGGFSPELFAAEEIRLSEDLKTWGKPRGLRFKILTRHPHMSSSRKLYLYRIGEVLPTFWHLIFSPRRTLRSRSEFKFLYDGRR